MLTRRSFITRAVLGSGIVFGRSIHAAEYQFRQFHNQTDSSTLHLRLVEMWDAVRRETNGRVETQVFAENDKIAGSDPAALKMLIAGELEFFTLMGGILGNVVPPAEVQQVPFAFRSAAEAHAAIDGALGAHLREEMAAKGIFGFPVAAFDNGMRQITSVVRPIASPADLVGLRIRIPLGQMFEDTFKALGAEPVILNVNQLYEGLKSGKADAQENPLAITELFKLYEVGKFVSMTNHMWSGFNLMANLPVWRRLPTDIQGVIERNARRYVRLQRQDQQRLNDSLRALLTKRGLTFNDVEPAPFRAKLSGMYATWKERLGRKTWALLEATTGRLA
jgi:tripartite ATP-independent transporter DctP family solute receptor